MVFSPKDVVSGIGTTEKVASSLYKWITGSRGFKRTVATELKENIELIRLYVDSGADPKDLISKLKDTAFRNALSEGFNFNSLKKTKIGTKSTRNIPGLQKYNGWETQRVFESVYQKVVTIKCAATIENSKKPIRLGVRLNNIFNLMVLLVLHIGGWNIMLGKSKGLLNTLCKIRAMSLTPSYLRCYPRCHSDHHLITSASISSITCSKRRITAAYTSGEAISTPAFLRMS